jgi:hypothetical protein
VIRERELEALAGAEMPALAEAAPAMPLMAVAEPSELAEAVPRRLRGKQAAPAWYTAPRPTAAEDAVAAEAWAELVGLSEDAQRQHVHYTHIRTTSPTDRQPSTFTRAGFWSHLEQVYRDVYPEAANSSGSILLFGAVAKEQHAAAKDEELRGEHHHTPAYCSKRHLWRIVAKQSHEVYNVKLHAAAHEGYSSMYSYICCPSTRSLWQSSMLKSSCLRRILEVTSCGGCWRQVLRTRGPLLLASRVLPAQAVGASGSGPPTSTNWCAAKASRVSQLCWFTHTKKLLQGVWLWQSTAPGKDTS